jgi:acetoin utilization deacetylase AcuC-like enzyme
MTRLAVLSDDLFSRHDTGPGHPERAERLDAVKAGIAASGVLNDAVRVVPAPIDRALLTRLHTPAYLTRLQAACKSGAPFIDTPDSAICADSFEVALAAAGGVVEAARLVARGAAGRAFCAVRPPGHHAERDRSMGFCLFNNIALAAVALRAEFGIERVLILDWDVHHGNGTQHLFEEDPGVLFISLHGHPDYLYPGTGYAEERGRGAGAGFTLNVPLMPGTRDGELREAFAGLVEPAIARYAPQFVLVSCGFDAHQDDPVGNLSVGDEAFVWMLERTLACADRHAQGRLVTVLEGGYNLRVLERCVAAHVARLAPFSCGSTALEGS